MKPFAKRTFNLPLLAESAAAAITHAPRLAAAIARPKTSAALREKVMLAVTSVNDCRYCSYVHTGLALAEGVDVEALDHLLDAATFGEVDGREATAILYAKHFADSGRLPSPEAEAAFARAFSAEERTEIMAYIHGIWFANLAGNSGDAWLARFAGRRVEGGHPVAEAIAALVAAPVLAGIAFSARRNGQRAMPAA